MGSPYRLHYAPDNASLILRLALEELGVGYDSVLVDRGAQAQKSDSYRRLNPRGMIPVLETPDGPVFETAACLLWLADRHGALAPAPDAPGRGPFLSWLFATSNGLHADLRQLFYPGLYAGEDVMAQSSHRWLTIRRIREALGQFEALAGAGHDWFAGPEVSVLDLYLPVLTRWLALYPAGRTDWFDLGAWPGLAALAGRVEARASVRAAARAEGLGAHPFTRPEPPEPPEGSAL